MDPATTFHKNLRKNSRNLSKVIFNSVYNDDWNKDHHQRDGLVGGQVIGHQQGGVIVSLYGKKTSEETPEHRSN
ncbi:hypothetical protein SNEBB_005722 [Seison nebaliae]|nr:hypothetical protein SNEBB_005722 [Seison nebaliae]